MDHAKHKGGKMPKGMKPKKGAMPMHEEMTPAPKPKKDGKSKKGR